MLTDLPAERAWLSGIVRYGANSWIDSNELVNDNCFSDHINQCIYTCLERIFHNNSNAIVDIASILSAAQEVGLKDLSEPNNVKYLKALYHFGVEEENVREFAKKIRKLSEFRSLLAEVDESANRIKNLTGNESISEAVSVVEKPVFDFTNKLIGGNQQVEQIGVGIDEYYESLRNREELKGIGIGYPIYEKAIGGLRVGVHIKGARNKTGKSYDALNCAAYSAVMEKNPTLYLDTELHRNQGQWDRFLARFADGITVDQIKYGEFFDDEQAERKVLKAKNILKKIPLDYINITGKPIDEIISIVRRWLIQKVGYNAAGKLNKCLVVYDYLKPPITAGELKNVQEYQEIGFRVQALHDFTAKYNFPILTYVQLNREKDIAASDRIGWYCSSYSSLQKKTPEEIATDGPQNGNLKLTPEFIRFGAGLDPGDYINYHFNGATAKIVELKTRNQVEADKKATNDSDGHSQ
jgi:replicative DNA helicase